MDVTCYNTQLLDHNIVAMVGETVEEITSVPIVMRFDKTIW